MRITRFVVLLPFAFVACGGSSEFSSNRPSSSIALEALPDEYAKAFCDLYERCAGPFYDLLFTTEECSTLLSRQIRDGDFSNLERAVAAGTVEYDGKAAVRCVEALSQRACEDADQRELPECEEAVKGTVAPNGECSVDAECEGSRICVTSDMCPGTCQERFAAGVACTNDDRCADGLVCSDATRLCTTPKQDGQTCGGLVEAQCELGLACVGESKEERRVGTCAPFEELTVAGADEPCDPETGSLCEAGLSCTLAELADPPVFRCRAIPAPGGVCGLGFPENCPAGEYCDLTVAEIVETGTLESNCVPLPAAGEPCANRSPFSDILAECEAYARCDVPTGNCLALRDLGETCSSNELCYSQNCVNGGCAAPVACQ